MQNANRDMHIFDTEEYLYGVRSTTVLVVV